MHPEKVNTVVTITDERSLVNQTRTGVPVPSQIVRTGVVPSVFCVVLNWNNWQDTVACLQALSRCEYQHLSVVVVDNGSTNDSVHRIRQTHPEAILIENDHNLGFAGGNNPGIRHALKHNADYVWLLNNDTEPSPNALLEMVRKAESNHQLGAVGSVLRYADQPSTVQAWGGGKVNTWIGYARHAVAPKPDHWFDYLTAASILVRRQAFEDVGLLDGGYFLYWEDTDFSFRLRTNGWKLGVAAAACVLHKENGSTGGGWGVLDMFSTRSCLRFLDRYSKFPRVSKDVFVALRCLRRILRGQLRAAFAVLKSSRHSEEPWRDIVPERTSLSAKHDV